MADGIELRYDPLLLPTAQHRAGLAGLLVLRHSLELRGMEELPTCDVDNEGIVHIGLTKASLQLLFDDLFDADWEERRSKNEPKGTAFKNPPRAVSVETGEGKKPGTQWVYEVLVPKAGFLTALGVPNIWRKLWRDAIWATLRGRPKSRLPYEQRRDGKPVEAAGKLWADLTHKKLGAQKPTAFSEALLVGAQSVTADGVAFEGGAGETLLLYFWPVVTLVGQARRVKTERKDGQTRTTEDDAGYVFTVPDVSDVAGFVEDFPGVVAGLSETAGRDGYRPVDAILAIPRQGALEYVYHLHMLAAAKAAGGELSYSATGFETYQLVKRGNNVPIVSAGRVEASERLATDYAAIRSGYWSPLFRAQVMQNLLQNHQHGDVPWYRGFGELFARQDWHLFAGEASTAFAHDARERLGRDARVGAGRVMAATGGEVDG